MHTSDTFSANIKAEGFQLNGVRSFDVYDAGHYLRLAHGTLTFITGCAAELGGFAELPLNKDIVLTAFDAVETLLEHGILLTRLDEQAARNARIVAKPTEAANA